MKTQLHISVDEETKKEISDAAKYLKLNISSFVVSTCFQKIREIKKVEEIPCNMQA